MINISLDLGNVPSVLQALQDPAMAAKAAKAMAESYNNDIHDWINAGRAFAIQEREGQLAQNINWRPLPDGGEVYVNSAMHTSRDENGNVREVPMQELAHYLEYGTGIPAGHDKWVIGPKPGRKGITIPVTGGEGYIVRRSVIHPGSRPFPFFFADLEGRQTHMVTAARSVLAAYMAQGAANTHGGING